MQQRELPGTNLIMQVEPVSWRRVRKIPGIDVQIGHMDKLRARMTGTLVLEEKLSGSSLERSRIKCKLVVGLRLVLRVFICVADRYLQRKEVVWREMETRGSRKSCMPTRMGVDVDCCT